MRRLILRLAMVLVATLIAALLFPTVRLCLRGLMRGEKFYRARPTSYWSAAFRDYLDACDSFDHELLPLPTRFEARWLDPLKEHTGLGTPSYLRGRPVSPAPLRDPNIVPVLMQLLEDHDPRVRMLAVDALGGLGQQAEPAVPALIGVLNDQGRDGRLGDATVGERAANALIWIDPVAAAKAGVREDSKVIPELIKGLGHLDRRVRLYAARRLYALSCGLVSGEIRAAVPALRQALDDHAFDHDLDEYAVSELAAMALNRIDAAPNSQRTLTP